MPAFDLGGRVRKFLPLLLMSVPAWGDDGRGLQIAQEAARREDSFGQFTADLQMILKDPRGHTSARRMRLKVLETPGDGDKTLVLFDEPRDVQGTAFLNYTHKAGHDDQWLYLPALKRVKRIASDNKSGPFMGSEFAYEDIGSQEVEKYTYNYLRDEQLDEHDCFVIERIPLDTKSGYSKQHVWIDKAEFRFMQIHYFDRKDERLKELKIAEFRRYQDKYWKPGVMLMSNLQSGKATVLTWDNYRFDTTIAQSDFHSAALDRVR